MPKNLFHRPLCWVCFALFGFVLLPIFALDYGLLGATAAEWQQAMGWRSGLAWSWFLPFLLFLLPPFSRQAKYQFALALALFVWLLLSAAFSQSRLGYATVPLLVALLVLASQALSQLNVLRNDRFLIAATLTLGVLIVGFIVYPIGLTFATMFYDPNGSQAQTILQQPYLWRLIGNSLSVSLAVGVLATLFGLILALYTTRVAKRSMLGKLFSILPMVTPPFVVGLGVMLMLGRSGYVTAYLVELFGVRTDWLYGFNGIVIAHTLALTPMAFMILEGALKALPPTLEEASYTLRASRLQTFFQLTFPLLKPAMANAFLVVVLQSLADFSTPLVLGGNFDVIASQIYFYVAGIQVDYPAASLLGILLLGFSLAVFWIQYSWLGKRSYVAVSGKAQSGTIQPLARGLTWFVVAVMVLWIGFNATLYGSIFYGSFTANWGIDSRFTLQHYQTLFGQGLSQGGWPSLLQTLCFALIAAPLTAVLGLLLAYLLSRVRFKGKKTVEFMTLLCFAVPGTVAGVSYVIAFNHSPIYLTGTVAIIILSMVMRNMPIGMRAAMAGLAQIDTSLDEASLSLKAGSFHTLRFVILPLLKPALLSALVTSFVRAMTTVSAIIFLVTPDTRVATSYILNRVEDGEYGVAVAYGSTLIIVMMGVIFLFEALIQHLSGSKK